MCRLVSLAALTFCLTMILVPDQLVARDDGRFANSPLKPWFDRLASGYGVVRHNEPLSSVERKRAMSHRRAPGMTVRDTVLAHSRQTCDPHSHQCACLHNPKSLEAALTVEESPDRNVIIRHVSREA